MIKFKNWKQIVERNYSVTNGSTYIVLGSLGRSDFLIFNNIILDWLKIQYNIKNYL